MPEPPDGPKPVTLLGRTLTLHGNRDDPYFRNAEAILAAQAPLQAWALRLQLEAMRRSTSWRVTAPLRALRRLV